MWKLRNKQSNAYHTPRDGFISAKRNAAAWRTHYRSGFAESVICRVVQLNVGSFAIAAFHVAIHRKLPSRPIAIPTTAKFITHCPNSSTEKVNTKRGLRHTLRILWEQSLMQSSWHIVCILRQQSSTQSSQQIVCILQWAKLNAKLMTHCCILW